MALNRESVWYPLERLTVTVVEQPWLEMERYADAIEEDWQGRPTYFFRGPVFSVVEVNRQEGATEILGRFTDYAHFLYSRRYLSPNHPLYVRVLFAAGCLVTPDGYLLVGQMATKTARPQWIQAVGGSPEPQDVRDGVFDPLGSAVREVREETGINLREPGIVTQLGVVGYTQDSRDGSVAIAVKAQLTKVHREVLDQFSQFQKRKGPGELARLMAVPLGEGGAEWIRARPERVVRYLSAFVGAPELRP